MGRKCPPGILCIENYTLLFFVLLIVAILYFMNIKYNQNLNKTHKCGCNKLSCANCNNSNNYNHHSNHNYNNHYNSELIPFLGNSHNNRENDVLLNPYSAPLRDDRIVNNSNYNGQKIPINVPTQSCNSEYRQIGILTRINGTETILPLLGRPLFANRDKWNFYTMNDKNGMIKLPIRFKNKSCTSSQGCDNLYNGDTVFVEGYSDTFRVTIYDNNSMEYIPYL
jgi:hypothetical protein